MKLLTGCLVLAVLAGAASADAWGWPWSRHHAPRLPKAIDSPVVRPRLKAEKATRQKHPSKYQRMEWGFEKDKVLNVRRPHEGNHSIFRD
jgi:hypothetical protein